MKPEEAIERIKKESCYSENCHDGCLYGEENCAYSKAISALKEIQHYRKIGTLEELARAKKYIDLAKKHGTIGEMIDECAEYEAIGTIEQVRNQKANLNTAYKIISDYESCGTVEECREAREKQMPKKCIEDSCPDHTHYKCPSCGKIQKTKYDNSIFGCILNNCSNCGQALQMENEDD